MALQKKLLLKSVQVKRSPPSNLEGEDELYFRHEYEKVLPEVYLHKYENVCVTTDGIIFKRLNIFEQNIVDSYHKKLKYIVGRYIKNKQVTLLPEEIYILAFDFWSNGYFHWMCDVLPRLFSIKELLKNSVLLLPYYMKQSFIIESLKCLNYKRIIIIPENAYVFTPKLICPEHIAPSGNYNPQVMHAIRNTFINKARGNNINLGERIFISRKKAAYRYIINEEEVITELSKLGFKTIYFEDYTFDEQISIMQNTKFLVGITGANLTNMIFMPLNSNILLFNKANNAHDNCYFSLANVFNHKFYYQFCKYEDTRPGAYWNLYVEISKLRSNLEKMLNN